MYLSDRMIRRIREEDPRGTSVVVHAMGPDPDPLESGTRGTVELVDDIGTVHCVFENGRRLGLIVGEDDFSVDRSRDDRDER